jgi:TPR repeat protein
MRLGDYEDAVGLYRRAAERGDARAGAEGEGLAAALAVEASLPEADSAAIVRAAGYWAGNGAPGKALDLLERATARHPGDPRFAGPVGELRRFFGLD